MRILSLTLLAVTALSSLPALAKDIAVDSKIVSAIIYSDRATLTRSAKIKIPAGSHNLVFTGLPVSMYTDSLRTEGSSRANVVFGALSHKRTSHLDFVVPKEKELNKQLVLLQDQRKLYQVEKQALQAGKRFLENLGKQAVLRTNEDIAEINLKPESWAAASDNITAKMLENMKADHALNIKTREVNEKIIKVQNELRGLRTGQKQSYSVSIPFESDKATTLNIDLSYQLPNVGWQPIYDARLDVKSAKLELVQYGSVWQRTGEDWKDIELTLSTAQPNRGAGLPKLHPHWISLIQHRAKRKSMQFGNLASNMSGAPMAEMMDSEADMAFESVSAPQKAKFQAAKINTDGFVGEYQIVGLSSVASDGTRSKLMVGAFETENALQVQIKPQLSTDAYLVVKTKLKGDAPILAGQVSLFRDGAYIGKTHMPMLRPNDIEELSFGIDDNIRVKRNTLKDKSSEYGLISKETILERSFVTEIQNLHKKAIDIAVLETIPVSQDERIRVEILKDKTTVGYESDLHDAKGVTRWLKTLKSQEKYKVMLGWKVNWPKGENISGL